MEDGGWKHGSQQAWAPPAPPTLRTMLSEEGLISQMMSCPPPAAPPSRPPSYRPSRRRTTIKNISLQNAPTLEEAAKIELSSMQSKTPVSVLQELLSRRGSTPKYELVQVEGAIHEPTFRYTVSVGEALGVSGTNIGLAAMGTGRSKKEAKHAAAKAILEKIIGAEASELCTSSNLTENMSNSVCGSEERSSGGNPIGLLQELCMTRRWPPPAYQTEFEEGLPHERQFTISCAVFKHKEIGTGKSKKIAKRLAAHKMWSRLKELPCENQSSLPYGLEDDEEMNHRLPHGDYESLKTNKFSSMTPAMYNLKVSQFHKNMRSSFGPKLEELQTVSLLDPDFNFVQFLQEIAAEQQFEVTFVDVEEKSVTGSGDQDPQPSNSVNIDSEAAQRAKKKKKEERKLKKPTEKNNRNIGKYQSLVQLSTIPVAVCYGTGPTSADAQKAAALNALQYLKLMTKNK